MVSCVDSLDWDCWSSFFSCFSFVSLSWLESTLGILGCFFTSALCLLSKQPFSLHQSEVLGKYHIVFLYHNLTLREYSVAYMKLRYVFSASSPFSEVVVSSQFSSHSTGKELEAQEG